MEAERWERAEVVEGGESVEQLIKRGRALQAEAVGEIFTRILQQAKLAVKKIGGDPHREQDLGSTQKHGNVHRPVEDPELCLENPSTGGPV